MLLKSEGDVSIAGDVDAALREISLSTPDLILLDLVMPGRDGFDLLEALAKQKQAPPVLVLTATRDPSAAERALALGAVDCLRKPFEVEALRTRVRDLTS